MVRDLESRLHVPRLFARSVAGEVEGRVLTLGLRQISTGLIRALVENELYILRRADEAFSLAEQSDWVEQQLEAGQPVTALV
jgi:hypothetical protein